MKNVVIILDISLGFYLTTKMKPPRGRHFTEAGTLAG